MSKLDRYYESVETHRRLVWKVGQVMCLNEEQLAIHDLSKYLPEEFGPYATWHFGTEEERQEKYVYSDYMIAWQHHINSNPHHWQHWILGTIKPKSKDGIDENKAVVIPWEFILEIVVDIQAAEIQYQKRQDMSGWLNKNFNKMILHKETRENVLLILEDFGYVLNNTNNFTFVCDTSLAAREVIEIAIQHRMR